MITVKHIVTIAFVAIVLVSNTKTQDAGRESLFSIGTGARALGLGGGFSSIANDASTIYYNPAGLALLKYQEVSAMYMSLLEGTNYGFASWVYPISSKSGIGIGIMKIGTDDIIRRINFVESGSFNYTSFQLMFGFGAEITNDVNLGISVKALNQSLDNFSDYGIGMDIGLTSDLSKNIRIGFVARDLMPPEIRLDRASDTYPTSYAGGMSIRNIKLSEKVTMLSSLELEKIEDRSAKLHTGVELVVDNFYALRGGYDKNNFVVGIGYSFDNLKIDYAYKFEKRISDSHRFSLSYEIGKTDAVGADFEPEIVPADKNSQAIFFKEKAENFYAQNQLDSAMFYYKRALTFDNKDIGVRGHITAIEESNRFKDEKSSKTVAPDYLANISYNEYLRQANSFFKKKQFSAALDMVALVLKINKEHPEAKSLRKEIINGRNEEVKRFEFLAEDALKENRYLDAISAYLRILEMEPENKKIKLAKSKLGKEIDLAHQLNKAIGFYQIGQYTEASKRFRAILLIDNNNLAALDFLSRMDVKSVSSTSLEEIQKNKKIWKLYIDGLRFMREKEYQKAIDSWNQVLSKFPNSVETKNNIKQAQLRLKAEQ